MLSTDASLVYRGVRPLQKLGETARDLVLHGPLSGIVFSGGKQLRSVPPDPWAGNPQKGRDLIAGVFRFAGQTIEKEDLSWSPTEASDDWLAELHSFDWLRDLRSVGGERARRMAREMVAYWLEYCHKEDIFAWRPDITGMRLASWISFHDFFCAAADESFRKRYFSSLIQQTKYLAKYLPENLEGIPLLRAIKGLAYAGLALDGQEARLKQAFALLQEQVQKQILDDGTHASRSPEATFETLQCLVDVRTALTAARAEVPEELQAAIDRIVPAVRFFRHNDGGLCQFHSAQEGNPHSLDATLMHAGSGKKNLKSLKTGGFEKLYMGRSCLIMDTGAAIAPAYAARHHAGLLAFEYCFGKDRIFVNCGTSDTTGKWQHLLRSTAAHTTVTVDHRNSCLFDENGIPSGDIEAGAERHEDENTVMIHARHTGYVPRYGLVHERRLRLSHHGDVLSGEDVLTGKSGAHFAARFHLHPSIQASLIKNGTEVLLRAKSGNGWRFKAEGLVPDIEDSVYSDSAEAPRRTLQIVLSGAVTASNAAIAWELRREKI